MPTKHCAEAVVGDVLLDGDEKNSRAADVVTGSSVAAFDSLD
jgi:hypothetical protein